MALLATVVDTDALLQTVAASFIAGVGITFAFAIAILGTARFIDLRADRPVIAGASLALAGAAIAVVVAAIVFGIIVMTAK